MKVCFFNMSSQDVAECGAVSGENLLKPKSLPILLFSFKEPLQTNMSWQGFKKAINRAGGSVCSLIEAHGCFFFSFFLQ